jgi:hypothetical protein
MLRPHPFSQMRPIRQSCGGLERYGGEPLGSGSLGPRSKSHRAIRPLGRAWPSLSGCLGILLVSVGATEGLNREQCGLRYCLERFHWWLGGLEEGGQVQRSQVRL